MAKKYMTFTAETSEGWKKEGLRTKSQAEKFLLPKLFDKMGQPKVGVQGSITPVVVEIDEEEDAKKKGYREVKEQDKEAKEEAFTPSLVKSSVDGDPPTAILKKSRR